MFAPTPATPPECKGPDGTLQAGILIRGAASVTVDLQGFALALAPEACAENRRFVVLLLQNCSNVLVRNGALGRSSEASLAIQGCRGVSARDVRVSDFEVAGIAVERSSGVRLERIEIQGSFPGARPMADASLLASYVPLLRQLGTAACLALSEQCLAYLAQNTSTVSDQFGCFGILVVSSDDVVISDVRSSQSLAWRRPLWLARGVALSSAPGFLLHFGAVYPCQGLYGDIFPSHPRTPGDFLSALGNLLPSDLAARLLLVGPKPSARSSVTDAGGFPQNCGAASVIHVSEAGVRMAGSEQPRVAVFGMDLRGRRLRGSAWVWLENCTRASVGAFAPDPIFLDVASPRPSLPREVFEGRLQLRMHEGSAPVIRWSSPRPADAPGWAEAAAQEYAVQAVPATLPATAAVRFQAVPTGQTNFIASRPGGFISPLSGGMYTNVWTHGS